ncbi:MAG: type II toxin-antitoxin system Phd/YefM family antitoxin [Deltaproteobacteria bacterium]|nr:type II toxin-antitoxin system Phd/YefM family antitoxin [Deltaproteobacteria bacterium]
MEQMAVSKFKATCLEVIQRVRRSGKPVLLTRFGVPVAEIMPPPGPARSRKWLGRMAGTARIRGDIVSPAADPSDWEAMAR